MNLNKLKTNNYYIDFPTNIGVYVFKNKNCLIIDTGNNKTDAKKIETILTENNLHPKYIINTHHHIDHCGGNIHFTNNYPGCLVYTSNEEKLFMEYQDLNPSVLFSSSYIKALSKSNKPLNVDYILNYGINKIGDEKFEVISLKGHSIEHIGIITPEKVCFLGDSLFSEDILEKYSLPYYYDIEQCLKTLEYIKTIDADIFVISHSSKVFTKENIDSLVDKNIQNINKYLEIITQLLDQPLSREDLLENICILENLRLSFKQYHIYFSAVSAFLAYMYNKGLINYSTEDGRLYYFNNPND